MFKITTVLLPSTPHALSGYLMPKQKHDITLLADERAKLESFISRIVPSAHATLRSRILLKDN
jgi:uncharacterized membrane protein